MNLDYRFPLFDNLIYGRLDPTLPENELNAGYDIRFGEQIWSSANDTGVYRMKYFSPFNSKCNYYRQLLTIETYQYCNDILTYLQEVEDFSERVYLKDLILDKHLYSCLGKLGELTQASHYTIAALKHPLPDANPDGLSNGYVFQLLKVCLAKAYLEIQQALSDVVSFPKTESVLYADCLGEIPPVETFLHKIKKEESVGLAASRATLHSETVNEKTVSIPKPSSAVSIPEYMTVKEVSVILKKNPKTVIRRIGKEEIKAIKDGGNYLIDKNEFEIYLKRNNINSKTTTK